MSTSFEKQGHESLDLLPFKEVWLADFEFYAAPGERPVVYCLVAKNLKDPGAPLIRLRREQMDRTPPYSCGPNSLFVAYGAFAELVCHWAVGWEMPVNVLDLHVEFRQLTNGIIIDLSKTSLLGALAHYGLPSITVEQKDYWRNFAKVGGPWDDAEWEGFLDYCQTDVEGLEALLSRMLPLINLEQALQRGRFSGPAASSIMHNGIPIDIEKLEILKSKGPALLGKLVTEVDKDFDIFNGTSLKLDWLEEYISRNEINGWPLTPKMGKPVKGVEDILALVPRYPQLKPLAELLEAWNKLKKNELAVGGDGRNRHLLNTFGSKTSRSQPSNTEAIFGLGAWWRGLIKPPEGYGLAYVDYKQQEVGVAAVLAGDMALWAMYKSSDCHLSFGKEAKLIGPDGTADTNPHERHLAKQSILSIMYWAGPAGLAKKLGCSEAIAKQLIDAHKAKFPLFWKWSYAMVAAALRRGWIETVCGWRWRFDADIKETVLANFPMQGNSAEITRLACCLISEAGFELAAVVHDAVLIVAPLDQLEADVAQTQKLMGQASREILGEAYELGTDATLVRFPDRFMDKRGRDMWARVWTLLGEDGETIKPVEMPNKAARVKWDAARKKAAKPVAFIA